MLQSTVSCGRGLKVLSCVPYLYTIIAGGVVEEESGIPLKACRAVPDDCFLSKYHRIEQPIMLSRGSLSNIYILKAPAILSLSLSTRCQYLPTTSAPKPTHNCSKLSLQLVKNCRNNLFPRTTPACRSARLTLLGHLKRVTRAMCLYQSSDFGELPRLLHYARKLPSQRYGVVVSVKRLDETA